MAQSAASCTATAMARSPGPRALGTNLKVGVTSPVTVRCENKKGGGRVGGRAAMTRGTSAGTRLFQGLQTAGQLHLSAAQVPVIPEGYGQGERAGGWSHARIPDGDLHEELGAVVLRRRQRDQPRSGGPDRPEGARREGCGAAGARVVLGFVLDVLFECAIGSNRARPYRTNLL